MYRTGSLIIGCLIAHRLCIRLRTNDTMAMAYSITDLWQGETPEQVSRLRDSWEKVLDAMSAKLDDETLRDLLVYQMSQSKELGSEVKAYYRESDTKAYDS